MATARTSARTRSANAGTCLPSLESKDWHDRRPAEEFSVRIVISFDTEDFTDPAANDVLLRL